MARKGPAGGRGAWEADTEQARDALLTLKTLRRSAIVATVLVLAAFGVLSWLYVRDRAEDRIVNGVELVQEYALRLVQTQDVMLTVADEALGRFAPDGGYGRDAHIFLRDLSNRIDGNIGIGFVRSDGDFLVSSAGYPPVGNVGDRAYLHETPEDGIFVDRLRITPGDIDALVISRRSDTVASEQGVWASATRIEALREFLERATAGRGEVASIIRADGTILLRSVPMEEPVRIDPDQPVMRAIAAGGGTFRTRAQTDGIERIYMSARVGNLPLFVNFGVSTRAILLEWLLAMAAATAVFGTIGASAYLLARHAERTMRAEAAQAELAFDRRLLEEAEKTAAARETMLRELNHRVKNSLQMIQALIRLQRGRPQGPDLDEIGSRVMAIAAIHDLLYTSAGDFEVDLAALLHRIAASEGVVPPEGRIVVEVEADAIEVDAAIATPLALCAVELVTNACKHAYGPEGGRIAVTLKRLAADLGRLTIADDGPGLPQQPGGRRSGIRVVEELVRQIGGDLHVAAGPGCRVVVTFPVSSAADRLAANIAAS